MSKKKGGRKGETFQGRKINEFSTAEQKKSSIHLFTSRMNGKNRRRSKRIEEDINGGLG